MKKYKRLGPSEIRGRIAKTLYSITSGYLGPKLTFEMLEDVAKEHWRQRAQETIELSTNILLNIGPANLLHVVADEIWEDGDKDTSQKFHDLANLLDEKQ